MRIVGDNTQLSASDLSNFLACRHLTHLDAGAAKGDLRPAVPYDLGLKKLIERGEVHEANMLSHFRSRGLDIVEIGHVEELDAAQETKEAIASGASVIYQAVLLGGGGGGPSLLGRPDFLVRPSVVGELGAEPTGYEVVDAKLARTAKARAVLQVAFYSALLADIQGHVPSSMHLALGNADYASFRCADFAAFERRMRALLSRYVATGLSVHADDAYPEPVEHCAICRWSSDCDRQRRDNDDLSLVAGMPVAQRVALKRAGIATRRGFADLTELPRVGRRSPSSLGRAQLQAQLQVNSEDSGSIQYELLDPEVDEEGSLVLNRGLLALPEPTEGDLFFDIEGARYYSEDAKEFGLQYLFGIVDTSNCDSDGQPTYSQIWAFDRQDEKRAFEELVDFIGERRRVHPDLHVYHYNHYEPTSVEHLSTLHGTREEAVGHLMGRFATREDEVDDLFRLGVFVDLYRVVRQGLRAGVESYSIKRLELLIGYERAVSLGDATNHLIEFEDDLEFGTAKENVESRSVIAGYNEDDCRATLVLRDWLEARRGELAKRIAMAIPRPLFEEPARETEDPEVAALKLELIAGISDDPAQHSEIDRARLLLADLLGWHRREAKPAWWRYFLCCRLSSEDLVHETDAIGELSGGEIVDHVKQSVVRRFTFPPQEHGFKVGDDARDPAHEKTWKIVALDQEKGTVDLRIGKKNDPPLPTHLVEPGPLATKVLEASLYRLAERVVRERFDELRHTCAGAALLLSDPPHGHGRAVEQLRRPGELPAEAATRIVLGLEHGYLPIQGPPGSGKTHLGAVAILQAIASGRTVGITAPSHAVIHNLLCEVISQGGKAATTLRIGQRAEVENPWLHEDAQQLSYEEILAGLRSHELDIVAGTTWLWAREDFHQAVDVLFVDEAGQLSLANTIAASQGARNLVMLGDPQQLSQPSQGSHPPGSCVSGLEHVLGDSVTMPDDLGLFLDHTFRMHPRLCKFTSDAFYEGRLSGMPGLERQAIQGLTEVPSGAGLHVLEVPHTGNTNASPEEAREVARLATELLTCQWTDHKGDRSPLEVTDILVVTPYNAQVGEIERALASANLAGIRVGTVDKFQGREAPAMIYSMATSSSEDAPRGMEFLFDLHRLNVATSRARAIGIIVASPDLSRAFCRTPRQMQLANALCLAWEF